MKRTMQDDWLELAETIQEFKLAALEAVTPMLVWMIERIEDLIFWIQSKTKRGQVIGEATYETLMAVLNEDDDEGNDEPLPDDEP